MRDAKRVRARPKPFYILAKHVWERPKRCCAMKNVFGRARTAIAMLQRLF
jgi:hypothetical protein